MIARLFLLTFAIFLQCFSAQAQTDRGIKIEPVSQLRTALVIGNSKYSSSPLKNPANDAFDIASALRNCGFTVTLKTDANLRVMKRSIKDFGMALRKGGIGMFYYAGHGAQIDGQNFLIPIGADIDSESEVEYEALEAGRVLGLMKDAGNSMNIVILDACRNNPYMRNSRSARQGLAKMDAPFGSLVAYSTSPGSVASDGDRRNGLYTHFLLKYMREPGKKIEEVFKKVRRAVIKETSEKQTPWESSSLTGDFYFTKSRTNHPTPPPPITVPEKIKPKVSQATRKVPIRNINPEEEMWLMIKETNDPKDIAYFLEAFPHGRLKSLAQFKLAKLNEKKTSTRSKPLHLKNKEPSKQTKQPRKKENSILNVNGKTWYTQNNRKKLTYDHAISYCKKLRHNNQRWSLPTFQELNNFFKKIRHYKQGKLTFSNSQYFWTQQENRKMCSDPYTGGMLSDSGYLIDFKFRSLTLNILGDIKCAECDIDTQSFDDYDKYGTLCVAEE